MVVSSVSSPAKLTSGEKTNSSLVAVPESTHTRLVHPWARDCGGPAVMCADVWLLLFPSLSRPHFQTTHPPPDRHGAVLRGERVAAVERRHFNTHFMVDIYERACVRVTNYERGGGAHTLHSLFWWTSSNACVQSVRICELRNRFDVAVADNSEAFRQCRRKSMSSFAVRVRRWMAIFAGN